MEDNKKSAVKSVGIWGSLTSLGSFISIFVYFQEIYRDIPQDLLQDTKVFIFVTCVGTVSSLVSLIGRWRAVTKISGILPKK